MSECEHVKDCNECYDKISNAIADAALAVAKGGVMEPSDLTGLPDHILKQMVTALRKENAQLKNAKTELWHELDVYKAEVARLEGLILSVARVIRGRDGLPCWCDDYDARPDQTHSAKCIEARRIRAKREKGEARTTCRHGVQWPDFCQFNCAIGKPAQREKEK